MSILERFREALRSLVETAEERRHPWRGGLAGRHGRGGVVRYVFLGACARKHLTGRVRVCRLGAGA
jgi:hypothetical protein